jgi:aldose 1-epimerase
MLLQQNTERGPLTREGRLADQPYSGIVGFVTSGQVRSCAPKALSSATLGGVLAICAGAGALAAPHVSVSDFGVTADGKAVHVYTLSNDHSVSARILDYGGIIAELNAPDRSGKTRNVVLGFADLKAYETNGALNSLIGRYANRIKGGFSIDGHHYDLEANAAGITLHSGRPFYGALLWAAQAIRATDRAGVMLSHVSPDGEQGFPGEMHISVTYTLNSANDLRLDYEATTDKPTVVTLTNHVYFNLAGNGSGDVYDQQLQVMADQYTPTDTDQIPTGELASVAGTALDFRQLSPIGAHIRSGEQQMLYAHGYDHNFVLRKLEGVPMPLALRMYDPVSGRLLEVRTTEPGIQVYSANHMNGATISAAGTTLRQGDGLALETEHFPNSPNEPRFPSTLLRPGETLRSATVFHITTDVAAHLRQ